MSFKARKLNIDITLDLTEYIPEDNGGILTTDKIDAESINDWMNFTIKESERLSKLKKSMDSEEEGCYTLAEISDESQKSIIKQIDFFYNKGEKFYTKIPMLIMNDILTHIHSQISPAKKK